MTRTVLQALTPDRPLVSPPGGTKGTGFLVLLVAVLLAASWLFFKAFIVASAVAGAWRGAAHPPVAHPPSERGCPTSRGRGCPRSTCRGFRWAATWPD